MGAPHSKGHRGGPGRPRPSHFSQGRESSAATSSHPLGASGHCQICPMPHGQNGAVCNFYSQPWSCAWILQRAAAVTTGRNLAISSPSPCFDFLLRPPLQILPFLDTQVPVPQRSELAIQHKKDPGGLFPDLRVGRVEMWTLSLQRRHREPRCSTCCILASQRSPLTAEADMMLSGSRPPALWMVT